LQRQVNPNSQDDKSVIGGSPNTTIQNERRSERPPNQNQEPPPKKSHHEGSHCERTHQERCRQDRFHNGESHDHLLNGGGVNAEVEDLKRKYDAMACQINGDEARLVAKEILEDTHLPFSDRVMVFPMPDKFKMPRISKYDGSGDPTKHLENFRKHLVLHGTPDEISPHLD
jgi:hypothetical protein